jgi:hypothetical protein
MNMQHTASRLQDEVTVFIPAVHFINPCNIKLTACIILFLLTPLHKNQILHYLLIRHYIIITMLMETLKTFTRQAMYEYVQRIIKARSRNHFCPTKAIIITYSVCVCVCSLDYPAWKAHAPYYTVICGLCGSTICSTISHKGHDFLERIYWTQNVYFYFLYKFCQKHFSL